ncbi:unnamed protein product, partial [Rotaria socialis]
VPKEKTPSPRVTQSIETTSNIEKSDENQSSLPATIDKTTSQTEQSSSSHNRKEKDSSTREHRNR